MDGLAYLNALTFEFPDVFSMPPKAVTVKKHLESAAVRAMNIRALFGMIERGLGEKVLSDFGRTLAISSILDAKAISNGIQLNELACVIHIIQSFLRSNSSPYTQEQAAKLLDDIMNVRTMSESELTQALEEFGEKDMRRTAGASDTVAAPDHSDEALIMNLTVQHVEGDFCTRTIADEIIMSMSDIGLPNSQTPFIRSDIAMSYMLGNVKAVTDDHTKEQTIEALQRAELESKYRQLLEDNMLLRHQIQHLTEQITMFAARVTPLVEDNSVESMFPGSRDQQKTIFSRLFKHK